MLATGDLQLQKLLRQIAAKRGLPIEIDASEALPAMPLSEEICDLALQAAAKRGLKFADGCQRRVARRGDLGTVLADGDDLHRQPRRHQPQPGRV